MNLINIIPLILVSSTPDSSALTNANAVISTSTYGNETNASPVRALRIYAQRLVASLPPPTEASLPLLSIDTDSNEGSQSREVHRFTPNDEARELPIPNINLDVDHVDRDMQSTGVGGGGGELTGCREAVEILTRNMRKGKFHFSTRSHHCIMLYYIVFYFGAFIL